MCFTDTHAHVYSEEFLNDSDACFIRTIENNVTRIFVPNVDVDSILSLKDICSKYKHNYYPMMGLHPCNVKEDYKEQLNIIYEELISTKYYAVGEIGMDLHWDKTTFGIQELAFIEQAKWAVKLDLPVSIHSREATSELIKIIKDNNLKKLKGVFHCFSGDEKEARELIGMGFYLGIGGVVTYKNSNLPQVLRKLGFDNLVLETDAPYLPPTPHRGKRNETSYIPLIAEKLAQIFEVSMAEIAEITTNNSKKLFGI
ncbi:MAG: TatD family hydrolase [Bacteroidia bacterium]